MVDTKFGSLATHQSYRVMVAYSDGSVGLLRLAPTLQGANRMCLNYKDAYLASLEKSKSTKKRCEKWPLAVFVEMWFGSPIRGHWGSPRQGLRYRLPRNLRKQQRKEKSSLRSGQTVQCILLAEKTRKGGWRARVAGKSNSGPITNWERVPTGCSAGDEIELRICGISQANGNTSFAVV